MESLISENRGEVKLATFYIGKALCGLNILRIQEINKVGTMTAVPQAPYYVNGVLNLRGQIVTVIDLAKKLAIGATELTDDSRNVIVREGGSTIGLLVNRIGEVVALSESDIGAPPANMNGIHGEYFQGVFQMRDRLVGILAVERVLEGLN